MINSDVISPPKHLRNTTGRSLTNYEIGQSQLQLPPLSPTSQNNNFPIISTENIESIQPNISELEAPKRKKHLKSSPSMRLNILPVLSFPKDNQFAASNMLSDPKSSRLTVGKYVLDSQRLSTGSESARTCSGSSAVKPNARDLLFIRNLGCGNGGNVKLMKNKNDDTMYAVKSLFSNEKESELEHEISAVELKQHPNLIRTVSAFVQNNTVNVIQEYADLGNLADMIRRCHPIPEWVCKGIASQILSGLDFLHSPPPSNNGPTPRASSSLGFIHRDLKPENILINSKGEVKLADFGLLAKRQAGGRNSFVGTSLYMSPERIQGGVYNDKSDIWAYGLIVMELIIGKLPFYDLGHAFIELMVSVTNFEPNQHIPENYSNQCRDHLQKCLQQNPDQRPTARNLLSDPWLVDAITSEELSKWMCLMMTNNNEV